MAILPRTIPASDIVNVTPGVLGAGGSALDIIALMLTTSTLIPTDSVQSFGSQLEVADFFGASAPESLAAEVYFNGFDNSTVKPGSLLFAQYNTSAVAAYIRSGSLAGMTLAQLQALNSTLTVVMDGYSRTASINFSGATSFSNGASIIATALNGALTVQGSFTASIAGGTMTVSAVVSGTLTIGQTVVGTGVTVGTQIIGLGTGVGGSGTYLVTPSQSVGSSSMTSTPTAVTVAFSSLNDEYIITSGVTGSASSAAYASGTLGTSLKLTQSTGAVISQGAGAVADPGSFMDNIIQITQDWATFMTIFDPDNGVGNANKLLFSEWTNAQSNRYCYVAWDTDASPTTSPNATGSLGYLVNNTFDYSGTAVVFSPDYKFAAFICGIAASLNFTQTNGRTTFKFRTQSGLVADVISLTAANNLEANGYNYYGAFATANQQFVFLSPGVVSGPFAWLDSYINQIWLNAEFQLDLMELMTNANSIPYNAQGDALIEAALIDTINQAGSFGVFRAGVQLSSLQAAEVNGAAGANISPTLENQGYYLQVKASTTSAPVRAARGSPPCTFWYTDGESVQKINLSSIDIQ